jgi:hypothetical protein
MGPTCRLPFSPSCPILLPPSHSHPAAAGARLIASSPAWARVRPPRPALACVSQQGELGRRRELGRRAGGNEAAGLAWAPGERGRRRGLGLGAGRTGARPEAAVTGACCPGRKPSLQRLPHPHLLPHARRAPPLCSAVKGRSASQSMDMGFHSQIKSVERSTTSSSTSAHLQFLLRSLEQGLPRSSEPPPMAARGAPSSTAQPTSRTLGRIPLPFLFLPVSLD